MSYAEMPFLISPLLYGEITHAGLAEFVAELQLMGYFQESCKSNFAVDLGSGTGKPSLSFALLLKIWLS